MLHIADELSGELSAETNLSKDVLDVCFDRDILIDHSNLFGIKCQFTLVNTLSFPEIEDFLLDARTDLCNALHFGHGCLEPLFSLLYLIQLLDAVAVWLVCATMHSPSHFAQSRSFLGSARGEG